MSSSISLNIQWKSVQWFRDVIRTLYNGEKEAKQMLQQKGLFRCVHLQISVSEKISLEIKRSTYWDQTWPWSHLLLPSSSSSFDAGLLRLFLPSNCVPSIPGLHFHQKWLIEAEWDLRDVSWYLSMNVTSIHALIDF